MRKLATMRSVATFRCASVVNSSFLFTLSHSLAKKHSLLRRFSSRSTQSGWLRRKWSVRVWQGSGRWALPGGGLFLSATMMMPPREISLGDVEMKGLPHKEQLDTRTKSNEIIVVSKAKRESLSIMSVLGNVLWITWGGGAFLFLEYVTAAVVLSLTIIGIPFGLQLFKVAALAAFPFGKKVVASRKSRTGVTIFMNVLFLPFGFIIGCTHLFFACVNGLTIVGLPFAFQHMKSQQLAVLGIFPFGKNVVDSDETFFYAEIFPFFTTENDKPTKLPPISSLPSVGTSEQGERHATQTSNINTKPLAVL